MATVSTFKALAAVIAMALFSTAVSTQDLDMSPSPAPAPEVGAAESVSSSVGLVSASGVLSMLAVLKN